MPISRPSDEPGRGARMKGWWKDTLFKRLFALMWVGLVGSHLLDSS